MRKYNNKNNIIDFVNQDCALYGRGRKKWWSDRLGVSPVTLSHWLVGRRHPNAKRLEKLYILCETVVADNNKRELADSLWQAYYDKKTLAPAILRAVGESLLKSSGLQTRLLALLSFFFEQSKPHSYNETQLISAWRNRLGWLFESAGLNPGFKPADVEPTHLLELPTVCMGDTQAIKQYLNTQQTTLGKKWRVYDCPLTDLKLKLDWRRAA